MTHHLDDLDLDRLLEVAQPPTAAYEPSTAVRERIVDRHRPRTTTRSVSRPRRSHRRMRLALVPSALAVAATVAVLLVAGQQSGGGVQTASAATIVLDQAADATERNRDLQPGQLRYVREIEHQGGGRFTSETWLRADGSTARRTVTSHGSTRETPALPTDGGALPWTGLSDREIRALTTDPVRLIATVRAALERPQPSTSVGIDGTPPKTVMSTVPHDDRAMFTAIMALHDVALPLRNDQRAALLRAAATIPGVMDLGQVIDPLGRKGHAIAMAGDHAHEHYGRAYVLSPVTGEILATLELRRQRVTGWYVREQAITTSPATQPLPTVGHLPPARYPFRPTGSETDDGTRSE